MTVSGITDEMIYRQLRIEAEDVDDAEATYLAAVKTAAVKYAADYTGLTEEELDQHEDITLAVLVLIADMYDHRLMYADKNYSNQTVETILGMHRVNLLPKEEDDA